jgi:hypothetical protein
MSVHALMMHNTVDKGFSTWDEFEGLQAIVKRPAVVFVDEETKRPLHLLDIVANTKEEFDSMIENKVFYTSSIEPFTQQVIDGRVFYGVDPDTQKNSQFHN